MNLCFRHTRWHEHESWRNVKKSHAYNQKYISVKCLTRRFEKFNQQCKTIAAFLSALLKGTYPSRICSKGLTCQLLSVISQVYAKLKLCQPHGHHLQSFLNDAWKPKGEETLPMYEGSISAPLQKGTIFFICLHRLCDLSCRPSKLNIQRMGFFVTEFSKCVFQYLTQSLNSINTWKRRIILHHASGFPTHFCYSSLWRDTLLTASPWGSPVGQS